MWKSASLIHQLKKNTFNADGEKVVSNTSSIKTDDTSAEVDAIASISKEVSINGKAQFDKQKKIKKTRVVFKYVNYKLF